MSREIFLVSVSRVLVENLSLSGVRELQPHRVLPAHTIVEQGGTAHS